MCTRKLFPKEWNSWRLWKDFIDSLMALNSIESRGDTCIAFLLLLSLCFPILLIMSERKLGCQGHTGTTHHLLISLWKKKRAWGTEPSAGRSVHLELKGVVLLTLYIFIPFFFYYWKVTLDCHLWQWYSFIWKHICLGKEKTELITGKWKINSMGDIQTYPKERGGESVCGAASWT